MKVIDMTNPKALAEHMKEFFTNAQKSVSSFMDGVDKLPEPLRAELKALATALNTQLAGMPPLEQVPAAMDAGWAINSLTRSMANAFEYVDSLMTSLNSLKEKMAAQANVMAMAQTSLNSLQERVTKGELVEATEVDKRVTKAAKERSTLLLKRREDLVKCGLPVPLDDEILMGEEAAFDGQKKTAKSRMDLIGKSGFSLNAIPAAEVASLAYAPDGDFDRAMKLATTIGGGRTGGPGAGAGQKREPAAGGGAGGSGGGEARRLRGA